MPVPVGTATFWFPPHDQLAQPIQARHNAAMVEATLEHEFHRSGKLAVCGVDEAGRGPLAGPVVAAAVILPLEFDPAGIDDSKKLSEFQREQCFARIVDGCRAYATGICSPEVIDEINILQATLRAMRHAVAALGVKPDVVLVDGKQTIPGLAIPQQALIGGDARVLSIACASIVAKVTRDRIMREYHLQYPEYGFDRHKGYPTAEHRAMIVKHGVLCIHRQSFRLLETQAELVLESQANERG